MAERKDNAVYLSWKDIEGYIDVLDDKIRRDTSDPGGVYVGIPNGGIIPAILLVKRFHADFHMVKDCKVYRFGSGQRVVIVDDIVDSGTTMSRVRGKIVGGDVRTASLIWRTSADREPDYWADKVTGDEWIVFPWEDGIEKHE